MSTAPPSTDTLDVLTSIWARVLRLPDVGPDDDVFTLGGSWYDATVASALVADAFDVDIAPSELTAAATPAEVAALVERRRFAAHDATGADRPPPVAVSQLGMVWHEQLVPGSFNLAPLVRRLRGRLDEAALRAAFTGLVHRHEPLRSTIDVRGGRAVQVVNDPSAIALPVLDLSGQPAAETAKHARGVIADAASTPFDLAADPLFQPSLIRFGDEDHLLVVRLHHTVFDDWSVPVYRRELSALYAAALTGSPAALPELPESFSAFARRESQQLAGPAGAAQLAWWHNQLRGAPLATQIDVGDPSGQRPPGPSKPVLLAVEPELVSRLRALASYGKATLFMTLLAAFEVLLHRRTGEDDLLLASVVAHRNERQLEGLIGCFTKKVPLRLRLNGDPTFLQLVSQVRDTLLGALAHQGLGYETVLQDSLGREAARHGVVPHVPIMFQGLVPATVQLDLPGLTGEAFGSAETQGPGLHVVSERPAQPATSAPATNQWGAGLYPGTFLGISVKDDGTNVTLLAQGGFHRPAVEELMQEWHAVLVEVVARPLGSVQALVRRTAAAAPERFRGFPFDRSAAEDALRQCPGVRAAKLVVRNGDPDGPRLVAEVVAEPAPTLPELRRCLWSARPGTLWPAELAASPPERGATSPDSPSAAELSLVSAWAHVLGLPMLESDANYWQSFTFLQALDVARKRGATITAEQVARNRTLETLATDLAVTDRSRDPGAAPVPDRVARTVVTPPPPAPTDAPAETATTTSPPPVTAREVIRAEGLSKTYPSGLKAVDALDLSVHEGEVFGLLGPNGAGKSTTVGMLTTLVAPTAGRAYVGGVDVVSDAALAKQYIGVVPQANDLDNGLTVFENLYFHGRYFGMGARASRAAADRMLERFRLGGRGADKVERLSGGMARRLQLARALMHGPAVAFLDEPTAGLDPQSRLALWDIVAGLRAEGQTVLLTTHYMEEAERFCDRVAIMDHGKILALDTPEGLKHSFGSTGLMFVRGSGNVSELARELAELDWVQAAEPVEGGIRVRMDGAEGALSTIMAMAERSGVKVTDVSVSEDSLETVFINLTGRELRE